MTELVIDFMKIFLKMLGAATVLVLGVFAVSYLQHRFDRADLRQAVEAVQQTRPAGPQGPTLPEMLAERYGVGVQRIGWLPEIESKTRGLVRVRAVLPQDQEPLVWQVDLVRFNVLPVSPAARGLGSEEAKP